MTLTYSKPCSHWEAGAFCAATPTRAYLPGPRCQSHTPAAVAGRPEARPDPAATMTGLREAAGLPATPPPLPQSASRVVDDRAVASGKRRSSPAAYREAQTRVHGSTRGQAR